ncbi:MAG: MGMT family protein [Candidatus Saccharimonadales bacterium]
MSSFRQDVEVVVTAIPRGRVMTYGQIAAICGNSRSARVVGGIAHFGDQSLPWHRVVNKNGGLASGYPGGRISQRKHLELEGVRVSADCYLELKRYIYEPSN